ncbi:MAG: amylo-alpha-1,6-glucosidase [Acidobacteriaceae bacterium]
MRPAFGQMRSAKASLRPWRAGILLPCLLCLVSRTALAQIAYAAPTTAPEPLALTTDAVAPGRFVAVHGRRALLDGYAASGLEVWAYPVQLIQNYQVGFRPEGTSSEIPGATVLRRIVYRPDAITRIYIGPNFIVREKLFVPLKTTPGAILTYTVESRDRVDIVVHFLPVLNLMWPAGIGGQDVAWNAASSGYALTEQTHRFSAVVGSTAIVAHDEIFNRASSSATANSLAFTIRPGGSPANRTATVVVASSDGNAASLNTLVQTLTDTRDALEKEAVQHYVDLRSNAVQIETPDASLNRDLAWAEVALDQAWVCNPYLGCGLVAGYGPSRGARRPQYAWFFAGDAMVAVRALLSAGEYDRAREALEFIAKYQDRKTGMMWHEMSQSAGLIDWTGKYPYMFVHVDISFQYLNTVAEYVAASGDKSFLRDHWQSVQAAYHYCESLIDPNDGLPRIPQGKEGGDEQDRMSDELTLSASWVEASKSFAKMATWMGNPTTAAKAIQASNKARESAGKRYWDEKEKFWIDGYSPSGKEILNRSSSGNAVITQHLFSEPREQALLDQLASPSFETDWGTRSTAMNSSAFNPNSYAKGSVWAVGTANTAMAYWSAHRTSTAFSIWSGLVPWCSLDSLGHMDEVLAGDYYHEQTESVPEQTWSSASFFRTAAQGMLGLRIDGITRQIVFAPHIPADWNAVTVRNIQLLKSKIDLAWTRTKQGSELEAINGGDPAHLVYSPEIPLGSRLNGATWNGKPIRARLEEHPQDAHASVELDLPRGTSHIRLNYSDGVSLALPRAHPLIGDDSRAMKLIDVKLNGSTYTVDAQVDTVRTSTFQWRTDRKVVAVQGAAWKILSPGTYEFTVAPTEPAARAHRYRAVEITVDFVPLR